MWLYQLDFQLSWRKIFDGNNRAEHLAAVATRQNKNAYFKANNSFDETTELIWPLGVLGLAQGGLVGA